MSADSSSAWDWSALYRQARLAGIASSDFWAMTPRELAVEFDVAEEVNRRDYETLVAAAWFHEYVHLRAANRKRLDSLRDHLREPGQGQTIAEQRAAMSQIAAMYNIPVRTHKEDNGQQAKG